MSHQTMIIDIYFDVVCPWCYIGYNRLKTALAANPDTSVSLRWHPCQLNQGMPQAGLDRRSYMIAKFGTAQRAAQVKRMIAEAARQDSLPLNLEIISRTPNTLNAHLLIRFAGRNGLTVENVVDSVFRAYLVHGRDIGRTAELVDIGESTGAERKALEDYLAGSDDTAVVEAEDMAARRLGIQAVPCFVINRRFALSGAQEPESFRPFLDHPEIYSDLTA